MSESIKGTLANPWPYSNVDSQQRDAFRREWIEENLDYARAVEARTGCPVSVTLAQAWYESHMGTAWPVGIGNNFWGVKCSEEWAAAHPNEVVRANDDAQNEPFRKFATPKDAFIHRSELLASKRYDACRQLPPGDCRGWIETMGRCGYYTADPKTYADGVMTVIDYLDLRQYDSKSPRYSNQLALEGDLALPLRREGNTFVVTSPYGEMRSFGTSPHKGIDLRSQKPEDILSTENGGKVVFAGNAGAGGNTVTVEYSRPNGEKFQVAYCHLSSINVSAGDEVKAGQSLGQTGNTGHSQSAHLHMSCKRIDAEGIAHREDPTSYLCLLADSMGVQLSLLSKNDNDKDYAAEYYASNGHAATMEQRQQRDEVLLAAESPQAKAGKQMEDKSMVTEAATQFGKELARSSDMGMENWVTDLFRRSFYPESSGKDGEAVADPISNMIKMIVGVFMSASMGLPLPEQAQKAFLASRTQSIDLSNCCPSAETAILKVAPGKNAVLEYKLPGGMASQRSLTAEEYDKLSSLSNEKDADGLTAMLASLAVAPQASMVASANFDEVKAEADSQSREATATLKV